MVRSARWMIIVMLIIQAAASAPSRAQSNPPTPPSPNSNPLSETDIDKMLTALAEGQFIIYMPTTMNKGDTAVATVRIARSLADDITTGLDNATLVKRESPIKVGKVMDISVESISKNFNIVDITPTEQNIPDQGYAEWSWKI